MRDQRFYSYAASCAALAALVGGFALFAGPPVQAAPPAPGSSSLVLSIVPVSGGMGATYTSLHPMVRHGPVTITLINHDTHSHGFDVPALGISLDVAPGSTVTYATTISTTGLYDWYCWHPCPGDASPLAGGMGMSGDLAVI
ncbi:MAG: hypothetical protein L3K06_01210 [Thermoplasmata archaeon]|nr:hypothetical protein [Thermoplasmata archaeon]